ncbi:hypothetical protein [Luethyella okanaganae]|uniref:Uncharacterized protein n=1 Tax=Luethyella okanaganae TaxID=69372 RepID=A0ABW1VF14_9MICO
MSSLLGFEQKVRGGSWCQSGSRLYTDEGLLPGRYQRLVSGGVGVDVETADSERAPLFEHDADRLELIPVTGAGRVIVYSTVGTSRVVLVDGSSTVTF